MVNQELSGRLGRWAKKFWREYSRDYWTWVVILTILFFVLYYIFWRGDERQDFLGITEDRWDYILSFLKQKKRIEKKHEKKCRAILEKIYHTPFPSVRPSFLRNIRTGRNLELDCYNSNLKLALEYQGEQHYSYNKYFHKSPVHFARQKAYDAWKKKRCADVGIDLIVVPYRVGYNNLEDYIITQLKHIGRL